MPAAKAALRLEHHEARGLERGPELPRAVGQHEHAEIGRDRVEPAAMHEAGARLPRPRVVVVDAAPNERHLPGDVAVVRAVFGGGARQPVTVFRVRPDGGDDDARGRDDALQRRGVSRVGEEEPHAAAASVEAIEHLAQLALAPPRDRPGEAAGVPREVLGDETPGEACCAEEDQIVGACHARRVAALWGVRRAWSAACGGEGARATSCACGSSSPAAGLSRA